MTPASNATTQGTPPDSDTVGNNSSQAGLLEWLDNLLKTEASPVTLWLTESAMYGSYIRLDAGGIRELGRGRTLSQAIQDAQVEWERRKLEEVEEE